MATTGAGDKLGAVDRELSEWRRRTLPFMRWMLVAMALLFFVLSLWQLRSFEREIRHDAFDLSKALPQVGASDDALDLETRARLLLESDLVARRYHQANAIILARIWTRYLGFLTGMVLALVGAVFVLGRLQESETTLGAEGGGFSGSLQTSSPGLVLAVLGSALMAISLAVKFDVETRDASIYLRSPGAAGMPPAENLSEEDLVGPGTPDPEPLPCDPDSPFEEDRAGCPS